jgi:hypothetical protein
LFAIHDTEVRRKDIKKYVTSDLFEAVQLWKEYTRFGLFHGCGPAGETWEYITLISAFEDEMEAVRSRK